MLIIGVVLVLLSTITESLTEYQSQLLGECYDITWGTVIPGLDDGNRSTTMHYHTNRIRKRDSDDDIAPITHCFGFGITGFRSPNLNHSRPSHCYFKASSLTLEVRIGSNYVPNLEHYDFLLTDVEFVQVHNVGEQDENQQPGYGGNDPKIDGDSPESTLAEKAMEMYKSAVSNGFSLLIPVEHDTTVFHVRIDYAFDENCHAEVAVYSCSVEDFMWKLRKNARIFLFLAVALAIGGCCGGLCAFLLCLSFKCGHMYKHYLDQAEDTRDGKRCSTSPTRGKQKGDSSVNFTVIMPQLPQAYCRLSTPSTPSTPIHGNTPSRPLRSHSNNQAGGEEVTGTNVKGK